MKNEDKLVTLKGTHLLDSDVVTVGEIRAFCGKLRKAVASDNHGKLPPEKAKLIQGAETIALAAVAARRIQEASGRD